MSSAQAAGDRALGEYLSSECTACHQTSGRHDGGIPAIVGVPADQFIALMNSYRDKQRENQVMRTIAGRLSQEEVEALASYYGSLKPAP
ncbi:sulfite dehydrogenase cytochrome subunit SoxD [Bosea sp. BIWAKO-01]|nr:sulfite dehydrogenase cytochrome subunit SoxD [Bosea sp. BIWAKO-01]